MENYKPKYANYVSTRIKGQCKGGGNAVNPERWIHGSDIITRDKYYAFLQHKAQARFRKEDYQLTFDDWQELWPIDLWLQRGRNADGLCLSRHDFEDGWSVENVDVMSRREHLKKKRGMEYKKNGR